MGGAAEWFGGVGVEGVGEEGNKFGGEGSGILRR